MVETSKVAIVIAFASSIAIILWNKIPFDEEGCRDTIIGADIAYSDGVECSKEQELVLITPSAYSGNFVKCQCLNRVATNGQ